MLLLTVFALVAWCWPRGYLRVLSYTVTSVHTRLVFVCVARDRRDVCLNFDSARECAVNDWSCVCLAGASLNSIKTACSSVWTTDLAPFASIRGMLTVCVVPASPRRGDEGDPWWTRYE